MVVVVMLDHTERRVAEAVVSVQRPSYAVEAALIGYDRMPGLVEDVGDVMQLPLTLLGAMAGTELVGVLGFSAPARWWRSTGWSCTRRTSAGASDVTSSRRSTTSKPVRDASGVDGDGERPGHRPVPGDGLRVRPHGGGRGRAPQPLQPAAGGPTWERLTTIWCRSEPGDRVAHSWSGTLVREASQSAKRRSRVPASKSSTRPPSSSAISYVVERNGTCAHGLS